MWLWLEPLDVLLFRDSRPFAGGESHRARSLFPPNPLTFQGAIRALLLSRELAGNGLSFADYRRFLRSKALGREEDIANLKNLETIVSRWGDATSFGSLRLRGPFIAKRGPEGLEVFFPLPLDVFLLADVSAKEREPALLAPLEHTWKEPPSFNGPWIPSLMPLWTLKEVEEATGYWLTIEGMKGYLLGEDGQRWLSEGRTIYSREPRFGIKIQRGTRTVEQGMLYMAEFIRLKRRAGFLLELGAEQGEDLLRPLGDSGLLALGGEGRAARYERLSENPLREVKENLKERLKANSEGKPLLKLYLAMPAVFRNGWKPDFLNRDLCGTVNGVEIRLIAAAVGKPLHLGGWDLALGRPKPLRRAVPPGSVYYFQIENGDADSLEKAVDAFHFTTELQGSATDGSLRELANIGFGLTLVGAVREGKDQRG